MGSLWAFVHHAGIFSSIIVILMVTVVDKTVETLWKECEAGPKKLLTRTILSPSSLWQCCFAAKKLDESVSTSKLQ